MNHALLLPAFAAALSCFAAATLHAAPSDFDRWRLEDAKRDWHNERLQGAGFHARQNDYQIQDALRRGEAGDPFWENDFDRLMAERQHLREQERREVLIYESAQRRHRPTFVSEPREWIVQCPLGSDDEVDIESQFIEQLGWDEAQKAIKRYQTLPKPKRTLYRRYDRRGRIIEEAWE